MPKQLTKDEWIAYAKHMRYLYRGSWYVIRQKNTFNVVKSNEFRRTKHGTVVAIIGTA